MSFAKDCHPGRDQLQDFWTGRLSTESHAEIEHHVADCEVCVEFLATLPEDSLVLNSASPARVWELPLLKGPVLRKMIQQRNTPFRRN